MDTALAAQCVELCHAYRDAKNVCFHISASLIAACTPPLTTQRCSDGLCHWQMGIEKDALDQLGAVLDQLGGIELFGEVPFLVVSRVEPCLELPAADDQFSLAHTDVTLWPHTGFSDIQGNARDSAGVCIIGSY